MKLKGLMFSGQYSNKFRKGWWKNLVWSPFTAGRGHPSGGGGGVASKDGSVFEIGLEVYERVASAIMPSSCQAFWDVTKM